MARTNLFSLLRRTYRKALLANELGTSDPAALETALRAREAAERTSRREALRALGGAAAVGALGVGASGCGDGTSTTDAPVVVVGGGIAGLHCAYRLQEAGAKVELYELTSRTGGRMYTGRDIYPEGLLCEIGGELIDSNHGTLFALASEFFIALDDRLANEPANFKRDTYWFGGVEVPEATIIAQFQAVAPTLAADAMAADTDEAAYGALDETTLDQYLKDKVPAAQYPELHTLLQVSYRGEFGLENAFQSALNLIYLIGSDDTSTFRLFGDSDERHHTHLGNDTFTTALADGLAAGTIKTGHKLTKASNAGDGFELVFDTASGPVTVKASRVVFALPFTTLREVDLSGLTLSADKKTLIQELGYGTNAKVMAGFSSRVWQETYNASGSLYTDTGLQQTWDTTVGQTSSTQGILTNFLGGDRGLESGNGTADAWWQAGNLDDLDAVWPGCKAAYTGVAVLAHWPTEEGQKGSYTCYEPGQWATYGLEGEQEGKVYFCGEHCSLDFQGWMEGAAETGGLVAAQILDELGLPKPQSLVDALGVKLVIPQAGYGGGIRRADGKRMTVFERRRVIGERLAVLLGRSPSATFDPIRSGAATRRR